MFFSITFSQTYFAIFSCHFNMVVFHLWVENKLTTLFFSFFFFFFLFKNRIFYISINHSLWIDLRLIDIFLLAIVYIWVCIIIKPTMHNCEICYDNLPTSSCTRCDVAGFCGSYWSHLNILFPKNPSRCRAWGTVLWQHRWRF